MYIAREKRKTNIAEYILYLWQLEDLMRALELGPEKIYAGLVEPNANLDDEKKQELFLWYMEFVNLMRQEGKEQSGHLEHTLHLVADLHNLHLQLLQLPVGENYRTLWSELSPQLPCLREILGKPDVSDTELSFRALYAVMLYRLKGDAEKQQAVEDVLAVVSPVVAELAKMFHNVENGEKDLFGDGK